MQENINEDINELVEGKIEVRSPLSIYAFKTNTIPSYLKVGDTFRPVDIRIAEWAKKLKDKVSKDIELTKQGNWEAVFKDNDQDIYFRDYSVHSLLDVWKKSRLPNDLQKQYSKEFFEGATVEDVENAIEMIKEAYKDELQRSTYDYYRLQDKRPDGFKYERNENWELRNNQKVVVDDFEIKVNEGKTKLLMYAVMRFGKSFTAISCAKRMNYKKVLVVSAKADVAGEWKKTVEKPKCFEGFNFLTDKDFRNASNGDNIIQKLLEEGSKCVVTFLTLQNLTGKSSDGEDIKKRLEKVLETDFDLIIIDESHYGAWASVYGSPLKETDKREEDLDVLETELKEKEEFLKQSNSLKAKVKLHLSGTPYSLLYNNEFNEENIIATCQFSDILEAKDNWNEDHFYDIEEGVENPATGRPYEEYDNPYFGFPKMLRFGFNLPQSARDKLKEFKKEGVSWSLRDFLKTQGSKTSPQFIFKEEVEKLLKIIDGSQSDSSILSFLNVPKIKNNDVCKHIVMALPFKKSCDAMEDLLNTLIKNEEFVNLKNYEILNIAGNRTKRQLQTVDGVKKAILQCENTGKKTITLTVNRMLTGVTVKEWDTMIMLKSTKSAQEYDQSIFRIQNQYVLEEIDENGNILFKKDMKPQTILVDFDPIRVLEVQGRAASIVKNFVKKEVSSLEEAIEREIKYLSTMVYDGDKLVEVTANNILDVLVKYSSEKSIIDIASKIQLTEDIKNNEELLEFIRKQSEKGISNNKVEMEAHSSEDTSDIDPDEEDVISGDNSIDTSTPSLSDEKENKEDLDKKYKNSVAKIFFYAFLTKTKVFNLQDILNSVQTDEENKRIFKNLGLEKDFIKGLISVCSRFYLQEMNNEIIHIQRLANDEELTPEERIDNALKRFSVIGEAEVVTPQNICNEMINSIGEEKLIEIINSGSKILDIASKTGEFSIAFYRLLKGKIDEFKLKNSICAIPTSSCTYEFTRKAFEIAGLSLDNIATEITSYSLLVKDKNSKEIDYDKICEIITNEFSKEGEEKVKFEAVVGNPPYQDQGGSGGNNDAPIYQNFSMIAESLSPMFSSLIIKAGWFSAGRENLLGEFRKYMLTCGKVKNLTTYKDSSLVFGDNVEIKGGICYYLIDKNYSGNCKYTLIDENNNRETVSRSLDELDILIREPILSDIVIKVLKEHKGKKVDSIISSDTPFGIPSNPKSSKKTPFSVYTDKTQDHNTLLYHIEKNKRKVEYVSRKDIRKNIKSIDMFKVFIPGAGGSGNDPYILGKPELAPVNSVCSQSYLYSEFDTQNEAENFIKYLSTKFFRVLVKAIKITQSGPSRVYKFVPIQEFTVDSDIDWSKSVAEIDAQLYKKYKLTDEEIQFIESTIKPME